jgi:hypothetical protein
MAYVMVEADVDTAEFDDDDLVKELEYRGYTVAEGLQETCLNILQKIHSKIIFKQDYSEELRELIWQSIGKVI